MSAVPHMDREEWVDDYAHSLYDQRIQDSSRVRDEISWFFTIGSGDTLEEAATDFYQAFDAAQTNEAMAAAGLALFMTLQGRVATAIRAEAMLDAEAAYERATARPDDLERAA